MRSASDEKYIAGASFAAASCRHAAAMRSVSGEIRMPAAERPGRENLPRFGREQNRESSPRPQSALLTWGRPQVKDLELWRGLYETCALKSRITEAIGTWAIQKRLHGRHVVEPPMAALEREECVLARITHLGQALNWAFAVLA